MPTASEPTKSQPDEVEWNPFADLEGDPDPHLSEEPPAEPETSAFTRPGYEPPVYEAPVYEPPAFEQHAAHEAPVAFSWPSVPVVDDELPASSNVFGLPSDASATRLADSGGGHPVFGDLTPTMRTEPGELKVLDIAAMVTAVVVPPLGLILGIVASIRGRLFRGWASPLARVAVRVSLVMIVVFALGGAYLWAQESKRAEAQAELDAIAAKHAAVVAESAPFCEALAASPAAFEPDDTEFAWPAIDAPAGYLPAITAYAAAWQSFVPLAPSGITEQATSFSSRVDSIVAIAKGLQSENRSGDLLTLTEQADISTIAAYTGEYCG